MIKGRHGPQRRGWMTKKISWNPNLDVVVGEQQLLEINKQNKCQLKSQMGYVVRGGLYSLWQKVIRREMLAQDMDQGMDDKED